MCGINGIIHLGGSPVTKDSLEKMNQKMIHRGPDSEGYFIQENIGLAMRRLSIIDLAGGDQPIFNEDRSVVVMLNGEIYNYVELSNDLKKKGHTFSTNSDTECLVHLYEEYGENFLGHLNGMFGFVLFDIKNKKVIIARDRLGIKPIYYFQEAERLAFSSDLNALKTLKSNLKIKDYSFERYLGLSYILHPDTIFEGINKLEPGHFIQVQEGKVFKKEYWSLPAKNDQRVSFDEAKELVLEKLKHSVKLRMRSDVPVGSFLSGGIDSSSIVALMAQENPKELHTFSVGFEGGEDELALASLVAKKYHSNHFEKKIVLEDVINILPDLIEKMDEPLFDSALIPSLLLSKEAISRGVKVILNGTGGDEVFGGYTRYMPQSLKFKILASMPLSIRKGVASLVEPIDSMRARLIKSPALHFFSQIAHSDRDLLADLMKGSLVNMENSLEDDYFNFVKSGSPKELMNLDIHHYLPGNLLALLDKTTMNVSLEGRTPLLDHNVVEAALSLPVEYHFRNGGLKTLLKETMAPMLPAELFNQKKRGFAGPIHYWVANGLLAKIKRSLVENPSHYISEKLDTKKLASISEANLTPTVSQLLFALFLFDLWCKRHYEGAQIDI